MGDTEQWRRMSDRVAPNDAAGIDEVLLRPSDAAELNIQGRGRGLPQPLLFRAEHSGTGEGTSSAAPVSCSELNIRGRGRGPAQPVLFTVQS